MSLLSDLGTKVGAQLKKKFDAPTGAANITFVNSGNTTRFTTADQIGHPTVLIQKSDDALGYNSALMITSDADDSDVNHLDGGIEDIALDIRGHANAPTINTLYSDITHRNAYITGAGTIWSKRYIDATLGLRENGTDISEKYLSKTTGDTITGRLTIESDNDAQLIVKGSTTTWAGIGFNDIDSVATDFIFYRGSTGTFSIGGGGSNVSGKKLHIDGATTIGSNYDSLSAPTNGLYVEGSIRTPETIIFDRTNEVMFKAKDSGGDYSIYHTINDSQGNYNIMLGVDGAGNHTTNDGASKLYFSGHGRHGYLSLNAAKTATTGTVVNYNIGLGVDAETQAVYVGNPNNNDGLDYYTEGTKIADVNGKLFSENKSVMTGTKHISSSAPTSSDGVDGDVWYQI